MATATSIDYVQKMFIAYLGRGASTEALTYWADQIDASGDAAKDALFYDLYSSAEGTALYDGKTQDQIINAVFQNAFERDAKEAGTTFYKAELDAGNLNLVSMAGAIVDSADAAGAATFDFKNQAAEYYRTQVDATDGKTFSPAESKAAVDPVDGPNSLVASKEATDQAVTGVGVTTTLTTAADTITLTMGDDTVSGLVGTGATYNSEDANDASTTDNDTLTLSGDQQFNFNSVTNIENINVSLADDALTAITIDADDLIGGDLSLTVAKTVDVLGATVAGQTAVVLQNFGSDSLTTTNATNVNVATGNKAMAQTFTLDSAAATVAIGNVEANDTTITLANNDVALSLTGTTVTNDSVTIAADNEVALTHTAAATAVENVSLSGTNGALEVTVAGFADDATKTALQTYTVTGDNDVTLIGAGTQFDSSTLTNSGTGDVGLEITAADTGNLEGFGVLGGGIELGTAQGAHTYTLASGNTVTNSVDANVLSFDANDTATTSTLTLNLDNDANGITTSKFETVTINGAATNALTTGALSLAGADATITSANDVSLTTLDAYSSITVTGDSVTSTGNIGGTTEGNDVTITSTNETVIGGTLDTVDTGNFGDVTVTAGTSFTLNGAATVEDLTVTADGVDINAGVTAANDITMTTTNDIDYAANTITATTGNIDLTAAAFTGSGTITASAGNITIDGTNDADATGTLGSLVATAGDIQLESGDLNFGANAITATAGTVKIIGDAEVSTTADLTAGVGVLITSTNDVALGAVDAPVLQGAGASGSITATFDAGASTTVTANTGSSNDTLTLNNAATTFTVDTGADNDTINVTVVNTGSTIAGNDGIDTFDIAATAVELATYSGGDGNDVFEVASEAALATIVGGDGTDSLTLENNGATYKDVLGFTGIEKLNVVGDTTTLDAADLAGNDSTFEIAGGDLTITNAGNANVTLSLAGVTAKADNGVSEEVNYTGGTGADIITGSPTMVNNLDGGNGTNSLTGGNVVDTLTGGTGVDTLTGGLGNDILNGGTGNDQFTIDAGTDVIGDLTTGDIVDVAAGAGVTATLTAGFVATAATQNLGSAAADFAITANSGGTVDMSLMTVSNATTDGVSLIGVGGAETLKGSAGADTIDGAGGADILTGNGGNDTFTVGAGDGDDVITDLSSGDVVTVANGTTVTANGVTAFVATAGTLNDGSAVADFAINSSDAGSTVNMTLAQAGDGYTLNGGDGVDILTGGTGADTLNGGANTDTLTGGAGADIINGNDGADIINGGDAVDTIDGGADADVITGGAGADIITGGAGNDQFTIDSGTDVIADLASGDIFDVANGAAFTATLAGDFTATADSQNLGSAAADAQITTKNGGGTTVNLSAMTVTTASSDGVKIVTGAGADIVTGSSGDDIITGAAGGANSITGDAGADAMTGGAAVDTFVFKAGDTGQSATTDSITAWTTTADIIDYQSAAGVDVTLTLVAEGSAAAAGQAQIAANGTVTFNAADDTLAEQIIAVEAGMTAATAAAGETAIFADPANAANSYIFISDGVAGVGANDVLIHIIGDAAGALTIAGGNITAIA